MNDSVLAKEFLRGKKIQTRLVWKKQVRAQTLASISCVGYVPGAFQKFYLIRFPEPFEEVRKAGELAQRARPPALGPAVTPAPLPPEPTLAITGLVHPRLPLSAA